MYCTGLLYLPFVKLNYWLSISYIATSSKRWAVWEKKNRLKVTSYYALIPKNETAACRIAM
jgi:hypothetical protein